MSDFASDDAFYDFVRGFSRRLESAGLESHAAKLRHRLDAVAWTTSSELIGELGRLFLDLEKRASSSLDPRLQSDLERALRAVREVWPELR